MHPATYASAWGVLYKLHNFEVKLSNVLEILILNIDDIKFTFSGYQNGV